MRAVVIREHGGLDRLELVDVPEPRDPAAALISVRAVALNHLDLWVRRGVPGHKFSLPLIPGSEVSGVIASLPEDAGEWKVGDEVIVAPGFSCGRCPECLSGRDELCASYGIFGETVNGGCAEKLLAPPRNLIRKPQSLSFIEAAAIPLDFVTSWHMLVARAEIHPGDIVLVHAGASGVGSAAIQIAKMFSARVITTVGSREKANRAKSLGADEVILYREVDFLQEVRRMTSRRGVDIVVEHVGADTFDRSLRCLVRGGKLVTCGATTGAEVTINLRQIFFKSLSILGSTMGSLGELHEIMSHVRAGRLKPVVGRVLSLDRVAEAHRLLEERAVAGKVVLTI